MSSGNSYDVIIVGGGIGGSASALRSVQNGMKTLFFTGSKASHKRSRSQWVVNLDNMIGFQENVIKDQVLKSLKSGSFDDAAKRIEDNHYHINNRMIIKNTVERLTDYYGELITIIEADATALAKSADQFTVTGNDSTHVAPSVIIATGIMDEQPNFETHDKQGNLVITPRPLYPYSNREAALYCIRCEGHLTREDPVAVIGNNESAIYIAFMLHERYGNPIFVLGNGEEPILDEETRRLSAAYGITIIPDRITDFISADLGQLCGVKFAEHAEIAVRFALINLGTHRAYNDLARQVGAKLVDEDDSPETSQVLIDHRGESSVRGLFVVGDLAWRSDEPVMKQVYTAQEYAVRAVDSIDHRRRLVMRTVALEES